MWRFFPLCYSPWSTTLSSKFRPSILQLRTGAMQYYIFTNWHKKTKHEELHWCIQRKKYDKIKRMIAEKNEEMKKQLDEKDMQIENIKRNYKHFKTSMKGKLPSAQQHTRHKHTHTQSHNVACENLIFVKRKLNLLDSNPLDLSTRGNEKAVMSYLGMCKACHLNFCDETISDMPLDRRIRRLLQC